MTDKQEQEVEAFNIWHKKNYGKIPNNQLGQPLIYAYTATDMARIAWAAWQERSKKEKS